MVLNTVLIGAAGAIVGGIVVTLLSPTLEPVASRANWSIHSSLGRIDAPEVTTTNSYNPEWEPYDEGDPISEFNNTDETWSSSMDLVTFNIKLDGSLPVENLRAIVPFDDKYVLDYRLNDSSYQNVQVRPRLGSSSYYNEEGRTVFEKPAYGAVVISSEYLTPLSNDNIMIKFLIDSNPDKKARTDNDFDEGVIYYTWEYHNLLYENESQIEAIGS